MHNSDTSKYSSVEMSQQGILILTENKNLGFVSSFQVDSYGSLMSMSGYWNNGSESNNISGNKDIGIEVISSKKVSLQSPIIKLDVGGSYFLTIEKVSNKTVIKAPNMPTTCTGQSSGTWANIGGFLKVCP
jgi:hypothetical protein